MKMDWINQPTCYRPYRSETDYPILLESARLVGSPDITDAALALQSAGIRWPPYFNESNEPDVRAIDRDLLRAWRELGYSPRRQVEN